MHLPAKNMATAFTYAGIPLGSLLAALLGIFYCQ
jgi:hypothetical protein